MDIASLGIRVQTQGAKEAASDLDKLKQSADSAQKATDAFKKAGSSFNPGPLREQKKALAELLAQIDPTVKALDRLDQQEKKLAGFRAKGLIDTETFKDYQTKIGKTRDALTKFEDASGKTGKTAKELSFAMRNLPAQFTDIAVSLGSGQRPLQVLLQQGGQIKDMFGGLGPALAGVGRAALSLINPFTIAAGVAGALVFAWTKAESEANNFNRAIALTGQQADLTSAKLRGMARDLDHTTEATEGQASAALAQVAASGQFTAQQLEMVTKAALLMERATGQSIEQTVKDFASLKHDPVEAILRLNEAIGNGTNVTGFLKQSTIEQIEKLKEQGRESDATKGAMDALFDAIQTRAPQASQEITTLGNITHNIAGFAREAGDAFVGMFRSADTGFKAFLNSGFGRMALRPLLPLSDDFGKEAPKPINPKVGKDFQNVVGGGDTIVDSDREREILRFRDEYLDKAVKKEQVLAELERNRAHYTEAEYQSIKKGIEERFKAPKTPKGPDIESATNTAALQAFEDELRKEQGLISNQKQILDANYAARNISAEKYYAEQRRLVQEGAAAQEQALQGEIAVLQARDVSGKKSIDTTRQIATKEAELARVRADSAAAQEVLTIQEQANTKARQQALKAYSDALAETEAATRDELENQVLRISVGEREYAIRSRINDVLRQGAKELRELARAKAADPTNADLYEKQAAALEASMARQVQVVREGYNRMAEAQKNWANGALKAFEDYRDAANDVAGQTYSIFSDAFRGLEDVLVDFFTKGKADWKGFLDGIAAEITRFVVRQQLSKLAEKFIPGFSKGNGGDSAEALTGAASSLAASAAPLLGAAAALSASAAALAAAGAANGLSSGLSSFGSGWGGDSSGGSWVGAIAAIFGGGRASGGSVDGSHIYEVGENNRPEILQMHGRSYLIPGNQGNVTPISSARAGSTVVNQTVYVQGRMDSRTADQIGQSTARAQNRASNRNR